MGRRTKNRPRHKQPLVFDSTLKELVQQQAPVILPVLLESEVTLSQQFVWMEILLERAAMVPPREKAEIQRRLSMYDKLWEEHPRVKKIKAEAQAKVQEEKKRLREENERSIAQALERRSSNRKLTDKL